MSRWHHQGVSRIGPRSDDFELSGGEVAHLITGGSASSYAAPVELSLEEQAAARRELRRALRRKRKPGFTS